MPNLCHCTSRRTQHAVFSWIAFSTILFAQARAQTIAGVVRDAESRQPVKGAFLTLTDAVGKRKAAVLSDSAGRFFLKAPAAGKYELEAERIGYGSRRIREIQLTSSETGRLQIDLEVNAVSLDALVVKSGSRCGAREAEVGRVWEEVRKALDVAAWIDRETGAYFRVRTYERDLNTRFQPLGAQRTAYDLAGGRNAFLAISADSLTRDGFIQQQGDALRFYGPDAVALLSDAFLASHCFRLERRSDHAGLIGLSFTPVGGRRVPDIAGTLWVAERSAELRYVEYDYVNIPFSVPERLAGGRTTYRRLPNGAWIVSDWMIRMPLMAATTGGMPPRVDAVREEGGEVLDAVIAGAVSLVAPRHTVSGTVWDSLRARPLARARVQLLGTPFGTRTDERGHFRIDSVPGGHYLLAATHPLLDSIPLAALPHSLTIDSTDVTIDLATPATRSIVHRYCAPTELKRSAQRLAVPEARLGVLLVARPTGASGELGIQWNTSALGATRVTGPQTGRQSGKDNTSGVAVFCAVPLMAPVRVMLNGEVIAETRVPEIGVFLLRVEK